MILDEYTEASQEGITFTRVMSPFEVDGINYIAPYLRPYGGRQVSRQMISLETDDQGGGSWLAVAANTENYDLDEGWGDYEDELSDGAIAVPQD